MTGCSKFVGSRKESSHMERLEKTRLPAHLAPILARDGEITIA